MSSVLICKFQMKGLGPLGIIGELALEHAIQMGDHAQCSIVVINHAAQPQWIRDPVNVS